MKTAVNSLMMLVLVGLGGNVVSNGPPYTTHDHNMAGGKPCNVMRNISMRSIKAPYNDMFYTKKFLVYLVLFCS